MCKMWVNLTEKAIFIRICRWRTRLRKCTIQSRWAGKFELLLMANWKLSAFIICISKMMPGNLCMLMEKRFVTTIVRVLHLWKLWQSQIFVPKLMCSRTLKKFKNWCVGVVLLMRIWKKDNCVVMWIFRFARMAKKNLERVLSSKILTHSHRLDALLTQNLLVR